MTKVTHILLKILEVLSYGDTLPLPKGSLSGFGKGKLRPLSSLLEKKGSNFEYSNCFLPTPYGFYYEIQVTKVTHIVLKILEIPSYEVTLRLQKGSLSGFAKGKLHSLSSLVEK